MQGLMSTHAFKTPAVPAIKVKRILYATDFSDASLMALPLISAVARAFASKVEIFNVCAPIPYSLGSPETLAAMESAQRNEVQTRAEKLAQARELAGLTTEVRVEFGEVVEEIDRLVREENVDLVVLSTHGRTGWKHLVMGSVAEELVRRLTCPVLTIGPRFSKVPSDISAIKTIVFPTDLSPESRTALPYIASLASEYDCRLVLIHVLPEETGTNPAAMSLAEPLRQEMRDLLEPQVRARCHAEFLIEFGDPSSSILNVARKRNADLIAMGVKRVPDLITHFRNTTSYKIVLGAECPVLTWRPYEKRLSQAADINVVAPVSETPRSLA
jgi:nucleotide-binding universal stress UspA family protein